MSDPRTQPTDDGRERQRRRDAVQNGGTQSQTRGADVTITNPWVQEGAWPS